MIFAKECDLEIVRKELESLRELIDHKIRTGLTRPRHEDGGHYYWNLTKLTNVILKNGGESGLIHEMVSENISRLKTVKNTIFLRKVSSKLTTSESQNKRDLGFFPIC